MQRLEQCLHMRNPLTEADVIRKLACRSLNGLIRCEKIHQVLSKIPMITNNELAGELGSGLASCCVML